MGDNDIRMLEYERQEQEFFKFMNQSGHSEEETVSSEPRAFTAPSRGLQCLLALTRLLEETVKIKLAEINSEKDLEDLLELRKQAERMGHTSNHHSVDSHHSVDELSVSDHLRVNGLHNKSPGEVDHHEHHKGRSLRVGTQMLSGTIGRVKTKIMKTTGVLHSTPSTASFMQRKLKSQDNHGFSALGALVHSTSSELINGLASGSPTSTHTNEEFDRILFNRQMSEVPKSNRQINQGMDRFQSLPDCMDIERMKDNHRSRNKSVQKGVVSYRTSYEEAVLTNKTPPQNPNHAQTGKFYPDPSGSDEFSVPEQKQHMDPEYLKSLNQNSISKDFAKKVEKWVANKGKHDSKEHHSKSRQGSNQSRVKGPKKRSGRGGFHRQRSMSADRAGLLAGQSNADFEEKLRQWGIKQAHDPDYYLGNKRNSRNEERSVESPGRLSRRQENTTSPPHVASCPDQIASIPAGGICRPVSIERSRRVSPSMLKRYSSHTSQSSPKSSSDGINSSSSSINLINQLSPPGSITGVKSRGLRSFSAESLNTDESSELEVEGESKRPLSMIGMPGSLESEEVASPGYQSKWSSGDRLVHADSKEVLRTINEDISKIRERKALKSDSSSIERLPERTVQAETTPDHVLLVEDGVIGEGSALSVPKLPSQSICVDSGLVMEEGIFRDTDSPLHPDHDDEVQPQAMETITPNENQMDAKNETRLENGTDINLNTAAQLKIPPEPKAKSSQKSPEMKRKDFSNSKQASIRTEESIFVEAKLIKINNLADSSGKVALNESKHKSLENSRSFEEIKPTVNRSSSVNSSIMENSLDRNQPLEPLLSSQSVSLKTKLQRLSTLYDCDDGEDLKLKSEEPSGPYEVFKTPDKYSKARSRSIDGAIDGDGLQQSAQEGKAVERRSRKGGSASEQWKRLSASKDSKDSDTGSLPRGTVLQVSPASLRKRLRSPVPVLDMVQRFDAPTSDGSSPTLSPTHSTPSSVPLMAKIAERLMQSKPARSHRYTVDLSRHVREIPKEGAVQRARSIFMDMQSS